MLKVGLLITPDAIPQKENINSQQENNSIVNSEVDEILFQKNQRVSDEKGAHKNIESDYDEN